jgi:hypothetical protein
MLSVVMLGIGAKAIVLGVVAPFNVILLGSLEKCPVLNWLK